MPDAWSWSFSEFLLLWKMHHVRPAARSGLFPGRGLRINFYFGNNFSPTPVLRLWPEFFKESKREKRKGAGSRRPFERDAAKSGSAEVRVVAQPDVDLHAVVDEARRGDLRQVERPGLRYAVEVPGEFATVRNEANDFAVVHVDPFRSAGDVDRPRVSGRHDRAL